MFDSIGPLLATLASHLSRRRVSAAVIGAWLLFLPVAGYLSSMLYGIVDNDASSYLPRSAESTQVNTVLAQQPGPRPMQATVVYVRESGLTPADRAKVAADIARFPSFTGGLAVSGPIPSADGKATIVQVPIPGNVVDGVSELRAQLARNRPSGLQASVTGPAGQAADFVAVWSGLDGKILGATVIVVTIVLLLTYRSPVLWLVPLLTVGVSYNLATAALYLLARKTGMVVSSETTGILPVLVFGAGTDYALLLIARYREELKRHADHRVAMAVAWRRAVPAIAASAATVSISLLCLSAAEMNSTRGLGPSGAIGVIAVLIGMTTLLPAVLVLAGRWIFWPASPRPATARPQRAGVWDRLGESIAARPRMVWMGVAGLLVLLALGLGQSKFGLSQTQAFRTTPDFAAGQALLARHYPAGASDPAVIVASPSQAAAVAATAASVPGVSRVLPSVAAGDHTLIPVVLADAPLTSPAEATIQRLRDTVHRFSGTLVGGDSAVDLDTRSTWLRDASIIMPLVLAVILVILVVLLRALVAPLVLIGTVVVSYAASLGLGGLLFQHLFGFAGMDYSVPLMAFVFLVALGVDYNIFLVTRIREEAAQRGHREGVLAGLRGTGGVITAAGIVLAATFSVLAVMPLVFMAEMGALVALGVLLDTLIVRSVLVPALTLDIGRFIWWPAAPPSSTEERSRSEAAA